MKKAGNLVGLKDVHWVVHLVFCLVVWKVSSWAVEWDGRWVENLIGRMALSWVVWMDVRLVEWSVYCLVVNLDALVWNLVARKGVNLVAWTDD